MPNHEGRLHLYLEMSKFATGSALYQIQNGKTKINNMQVRGFPKQLEVIQ